eukprot:Em0023g753a
MIGERDLTMSRRDKKLRQTFPGPNAADNQQMLQDIKQTLGDHQKNEPASLPPADQMNKRSSPPTELPTSSSPSIGNRTPASRLTPTKQLAAHETKQKLAQIRQSIKPYGPRNSASDPGFHAAKEKVNKKMLDELISLGHSENCAVEALLECNSASVDKALEFIQRKADKKKLTAIQEDAPDFVPVSPVDYESRHGRRSEDKTPTPEDFLSTETPPARKSSTSKISRRNSPEKPIRAVCQYDASDVSRMSPITLPGFSTPINFIDPQPFRPTPIKPQQSDSSFLIQQQQQNDDSSPTRNSPMPLSCASPPISDTNVHAHVSPPPEVQPQSYSPFSATFSSYRSPTAATHSNTTLLTQRQHAPSTTSTSNSCTPVDLIDSGIEDESAPRRTPVPPEAFKFFMEQHMETIVKAYQQRQQRRFKLETEMAKRKLDEASSEQMRKILYSKESQFLRLKRAKMSRDMFKVVKPLGVGAFGIVSLVQKVDTKKLYAMKTLRKADVLRRNQVAHVKAERDILAEADNEWVVKLFFSFQDEENLYFVMEYIPGGDMMSLLIKLGTFPEHLTLFYIAELVCAIESVHKMGFIHRDIKPDNILIGADGHIKLTDFGLCTGFRWTHDSRRYQPEGVTHHNRQASIEPIPGEECTCCDDRPHDLKPLELRKFRERHRCTAHSLVGTPNYIATEILRREGYTQLCDWWSVGVIMYEMMVGQPPFMSQNAAETQLKIINWRQHLHIPRLSHMSHAAVNLIKGLCCDPQDRLGRNGPEEIKQHLFFSAIEWSVGIRNYEPPYVPKIMHEADTSNFDPIPQNMLQKMNKKQEDPFPQGHPKHAFYEFTFIRFYSDKASKDRKPTLTDRSVYSGPMQGGVAEGSSSPPKERTTTTASQPVYV